MPTYVYECAKCGEEMEEWQSFSEEPLKKHPGCGGKLSKVLQPVGIVFKGSGFHRTDSRSAAKRSHSNGSSDGKDSSESSDSGKSEKSDSKTDSSASSDSSKKSSDSKSSSDKKDNKKASTSTSK
jgi:putative FmdB family regulatory protein